MKCACIDKRRRGCYNLVPSCVALVRKWVTARLLLAQRDMGAKANVMAQNHWIKDEA